MWFFIIIWISIICLASYYIHNEKEGEYDE